MEQILFCVTTLLYTLYTEYITHLRVELGCTEETAVVATTVEVDVESVTDDAETVSAVVLVPLVFDDPPIADVLAVAEVAKTDTVVSGVF